MTNLHPSLACGRGAGGEGLQRPLERVALARVAGLHADPEPLDALVGGAVGPGLGIDRAAGLLLDAVVADRRGGGERLFDIPRIEDDALARIPPLGRFVAPASGEAVRLQLHPYGESIRFPRVLLLELAHLLVDPGQVLDVVPELVREHVGLREVAGRSEALLELLIEPEVDVGLLVDGAVERSHGGLAGAAAGLGGVREQHQLGRLIALARAGELLLPRVLDVVEDRGHEIAHLVVLGRDRGLGRHRSTAPASEEGEEVGLEDEAENQKQEKAADPQSPDWKTEAAASTLPPAILYVGATAAWCPAHGQTPFRTRRMTLARIVPGRSFD